MLLNTIFCSHLSFIKWLQNFLIPCPFKKFTGIDCPGCGFQRSFLALLQGDFSQSIHLYPATIPLLLVSIYTIADGIWPINAKTYVKKIMYMATAAIILVAYVAKMGRYF